MTQQQRKDEEQARQDELQGRVSGLVAQGAMSWVWPDNKNRFFTGLPAPKKQHENAHKCNWTPLPGYANKRHKKRQRALMQRSGAKGVA